MRLYTLKNDKEFVAVQNKKGGFIPVKALGLKYATMNELDEMRQKSNTSFMIQTVAGAIEELTQGMTLKKGTVIATGTPGGVAMGMHPPKYLKPGDKVECYIESIGMLTNFVGNMEA